MSEISKGLKKYYQTEKGKRSIEQRNVKRKLWWKSAAGQAQKEINRQRINELFSTEDGKLSPEAFEVRAQVTREGMAGEPVDNSFSPLTRRAMDLQHDLDLTLPLYVIIGHMLQVRKEDLLWIQAHPKDEQGKPTARRSISVEFLLRKRLLAEQKLYEGVDISSEK